MSESLLEIGSRAAEMAQKLGADQVEAYVASSHSFSIEVENSSIKSASERRDAGIGIRSVVRKGIGFAYVTTILEADLIEAAERSVALAKASLPDPDFVSLPTASESYPTIEGLVDPAIGKLTSDEAASMLIRAVEATKVSVGGVTVAIEGSITTSKSTRAIVNSLGIEGTRSSSSIFLYAYPTVKTEDDQNSSFEYQVSRKLKDIDPEWIGTNAGKNAIANLGGKTVENGGDMPIILSPLAVGTILGNGFGGAINAEEVQYGRSYISDALGKEIASQTLEIVDNALLPSGIGSRPFDAEGYPSRRTVLLDNGVLKSLLHNSYSANKDQVENTGNASRASYSGIPSISTSNMVITPGKGSLDDLISEIDKGVYIRNTWDRPNMTTGDLSAMVAEGFYIEQGSLSHPVKNTLVGINMSDVLRRVYLVGEDTRVTSSVVSPSIVIESAKVTSG